MIGRTGIAFSNQTTLSGYGPNQNTECLIDTLPALKCSLYYGLCYLTQQKVSVTDLKGLDDLLHRDLKKVYDWDFVRFQEELICTEQLKPIFKLWSYWKDILEAYWNEEDIHQQIKMQSLALGILFKIASTMMIILS